MVTATRLIKVIILKYTETANHYFVYQDLTSYCRSIILQKSKKQNKTHRKRGQICSHHKWEWGGGIG